MKLYIYIYIHVKTQIWVSYTQQRHIHTQHIASTVLHHPHAGLWSLAFLPEVPKKLQELVEAEAGAKGAFRLRGTVSGVVDAGHLVIFGENTRGRQLPTARLLMTPLDIHVTTHFNNQWWHINGHISNDQCWFAGICQDEQPKKRLQSNMLYGWSAQKHVY